MKQSHDHASMNAGSQQDPPPPLRNNPRRQQQQSRPLHVWVFGDRILALQSRFERRFGISTSNNLADEEHGDFVDPPSRGPSRLSLPPDINRLGQISLQGRYIYGQSSVIHSRIRPVLAFAAGTSMLGSTSSDPHDYHDDSNALTSVHLKGMQVTDVRLPEDKVETYDHADDSKALPPRDQVEQMTNNDAPAPQPFLHPHYQINTACRISPSPAAESSSRASMPGSTSASRGTGSPAAASASPDDDSSSSLPGGNILTLKLPATVCIELAKDSSSIIIRPL